LLLADLYRGLPVFDEHGEPTGEYQEVITREQFLRLMDMPAHLDATPGDLLAESDATPGER